MWAHTVGDQLSQILQMMNTRMQSIRSYTSRARSFTLSIATIPPSLPPSSPYIFPIPAPSDFDMLCNGPKKNRFIEYSFLERSRCPVFFMRISCAFENHRQGRIEPTFLCKCPASSTDGRSNSAGLSCLLVVLLCI